MTQHSTDAEPEPAKDSLPTAATPDVHKAAQVASASEDAAFDDDCGDTGPGGRS